MSKARIIYFLDIALFLSFIAVAFSAIAILTRQPSFLGVPRGAHILSGEIFIVIAIIHFLLHIGWILNMTKSLFKNAGK